MLVSNTAAKMVPEGLGHTAVLDGNGCIAVHCRKGSG